MYIDNIQDDSLCVCVCMCVSLPDSRWSCRLCYYASGCSKDQNNVGKGESHEQLKGVN